MGSSTTSLDKYQDKKKVRIMASRPEEERIILNIMAKSVELAHSTLMEHAHALGSTLPRQQFDNAIKRLVSEGHLDTFVEGGEVWYFFIPEAEKRDEVSRPNSNLDILDNLS